MQTAVIACIDLRRSYQQGTEEIAVLRGVQLEVARGERLAIVGASGSGKSTLLNMLGGLDLPSGGRVLIQGQDINQLSERERCTLRNRQLGFVYQFHHLLREFSAEENVAMPLLIAGQERRAAQAEAGRLLDAVGLASRRRHRPSALSGGERQRVAIARALVMRPACVLLDEPTGNLDRQTAESIHSLMDQLNREFATSFVVVTHDPALAARMDRRLLLQDGLLQAQP
ncbi:MAG TPA: lipoprotein-releasing ABC transporter ATP-binding protein LolD [Spongiibacteraceae bacterium]|nr:lipoprotein-releasing ABC transporter ATP-binding protein LolD [Spongiibacteraceae bacterium]